MQAPWVFSRSHCPIEPTYIKSGKFYDCNRNLCLAIPARPRIPVLSKTILDSSGTNRTNNLPCSTSLTSYDAAGNQTCDTDSNGAARGYSFDAENRVRGITISGSSAPFETYTYGADGDRVRKDNADGTWNEYVYFNGQPMAEKDQSGAWTDLIYANGRQIARVEPFDVRAHLSGDRVDASNSEVWGAYVLPVPSPGYVIKPGACISL